MYKFFLSARKFIALCSALAALTSLAAQEFTPAKLHAAAAYSRKTDGRSLIIWHNKHILLEDYPNGGAANHPTNVRSITKSLWSLAILASADAGDLNLDSPASAILSDWQNTRGKSEITIRELLTMTSGLSPSGSLVYRNGTKNLRAIISMLPITYQHGTAWEYGASNYETLGEILRRRYPGERASETWLRESVTRPAQMNQPAFRRDKLGINFTSAGAYLTARDLLNLGISLLNKNALPIRPKTLRAAFTGTPLNPAYGMGFWLNTSAAHPDAIPTHFEDLLSLPPGRVNWAKACFSHDAPADMIVMLGSSGQRVFICPSQNIVIVRQGESPEWRDAAFWELLRP